MSHIGIHPAPVDQPKTPIWLDFQVISDELEGDGDTWRPKLKEFKRFSELPFELRAKVWRAAIMPRTIMVTCFDRHTKDHKRAEAALRPRRHWIPKVFQICHESREVALKTYERTFAWKVPPRLSGPETSVLPISDEAQVLFNFEQDALLLLGELEPYDQYGFSSPMVYFLRKEDTARVRHIACAFEGLQLSLYESDQVFGTLFHIIDRFPLASRLLVTTTDRDAETRKLKLPTTDNVLQKLWRAFLNGTTCANVTLASKQILMIKEDELTNFIAYNFAGEDTETLAN
ncbi:hypothetical protein QBC35DRAFT_96560 [Podospora australis]|uniref:2EXR domain-containing protein n=1 Tax=Podospora australis TaxID=1536484 RepID=A0AAN7AIT8_9PEZI|nr:hypothetical protein QBC35DRAFT_96560 [Podospora australis]